MLRCLSRLMVVMVVLALLPLAGLSARFMPVISSRDREAWAASQRLPVHTIAPQQIEAYFQFDVPPATDTFIFLLTDPGKIDEARRMLSGQSPPRHVMGEIVKQPAAYNPPWHYHLALDSVQFFDHAVEVCDASIQMVEEHLQEACETFLPDCIWCPWNSRLLQEVTPAPSPTSPPPDGELFLPMIRSLRKEPIQLS